MNCYCGEPLDRHYSGIGCIEGRPGGRVIDTKPYAPTEADRRGHTGHKLAARPHITPDGWDARIMECEDCGDTWTEVRAMPAEGILIDPDPHLPAGHPA